MSTKHLRYSLSLSRLPNDCCSLAKSILANEQSNNERSFLNSLLAYGFMNRRDRDCNFFTTSFVGNTSNERLHQFSMPISEENKIFVDHILSFRQGKLRTTEYNYLLFCGFNTFIETCKRYVFSEKYLLVNLQNEIKNEIYLINMHSFILMLVASVVMSISMVPHYILYSQKKDKLIIFIHVLSFLIFVIILFFLHEYFSAVIVPIMLLLVNVFILVTKSFFALRNVRSS